MAKRVFLREEFHLHQKYNIQYFLGIQALVKHLCAYSSLGGAGISIMSSSG